MPALIEENTVYDVKCPECGPIDDGVDTRSEAEFIADSHDNTWHAPVFDDELVQS